MQLPEMLTGLRIELQDTDQAIYTPDELVRAVEKSISLMSRLLPKRSVVETTVVRAIEDETLTISSSTGTLAYKPIKVGSLVITGKTLDTDYRVNYLTGVITEIGSNLPDTDYTANYTLDPLMLDISSLLSDYVRVERMEYPAGSSPASLPTFDIVGDFVVLRGSSITFTEDKHARLTYLGRWTPPDVDSDGDYPSHLDDAIIIGSNGQALIFKAEKYTQLSATTVTSVLSVLAGLDSLSLTAPTLTPPTAPSIANLTPPTAPTLTDLTAPTAPSMDDLTTPTAPTLTDLTPPTDYAFSKPNPPNLPDIPSAPTSPTLSFTAVEYALGRIANEIAEGRGYLSEGDNLINSATRGERCGEIYGQYANVLGGFASVYVGEVRERLKQLEVELTQYASEVTSFGSEINQYANEVSGIVSKYRGTIEAEMAGVNNFAAQISKYAAEVNEENLKIGKYSEEIRSFQIEVSEQNLAIAIFDQEVRNYQAEINEESLKIGKYQAQVGAYQAEVAEQNLALSKYSEQVRSYQSEVGEYQADIAAYNAKVNAIITRAAQATIQVESYLRIAGRYLASGQAKINEFLISLGLKPEFPTQKASSEQRS